MAYEQKPNTGALFVNKKQTGNQPNLRGSVYVDKVFLENLINGSKGLVEISIAGWNQKSKAGDPYISLAVSEPYKKDEGKQPWE